MRAGRGVVYPPPQYIVGVGGSAGALPAYRELLDALPPDTGMAFVIVSHMSPTAHSELAKILSRHTKMPIIVASTKMPIMSNHVYVITPDSDILIKNFTLKVLSPRSGGKQIDLLFVSLAEAMGTRAIGVVLSGYNGDGAEGCKAIKAKGGITFAQDMSAEVPHMPLTAQAMGFVDFVMSPAKISAKLKKLAAALKA